MGSAADQDRRDLLELLDLAVTRLEERMSGLSVEEWAWTPSTRDPRLSIRWRLEHLVAMLRDPRNREWLGADVEPSAPAPAAVSSPEEAVAAVASAYAWLRDLVADSAVVLGGPIGPAAGAYAEATKRSFVLHLTDELIHHAAEAALLRDLYAGR